MRTVAPVSPGEMLEEEFLKPLGLTKYRLAKDIGVPAQRIGEIVAGKRAITADTDLRLCRYFGLSDGWWLRGQAAYDTAVTKEALHKELAAIQRCSLLAA
jgi:addiction module HigA family antidote